MHLPPTLLLSLSLLFPLLTHAIALPQPAADIVMRQDPALPSADPELDIDIPDDGVPRAPGGPVVGKFTKPSFVPRPDDNVLPFPNSVQYCPDGVAYCCGAYPPTGGTLCVFNGDGHLGNCEIQQGMQSVCCSKTDFGCKGMTGLKPPITTN